MNFNPNSMCIWWPVVSKLDILVPNTFIIQAPEECPDLLDEFFYAISDGKPPLPGWYEWWGRAKAAAVEYLGDGPYFMRTDLHSGKHSWKDTCYCPTAAIFDQNIYSLLEDWHCGFTSGFDPRALVFREFLDLDSRFEAFQGMPVAPERRYFVRDGECECHHPYWPEDAMQFFGGRTPPDNWREQLAELNTESPDEIELLTDYAEQVAAVMPGYWSVDFAHGRNGTWYLIDMATGEESWHPDGCEHKGEEA